MIEPLPISSARWNELASWLREIPAADRDHWRLSPPEMSFGEAARWARELGASKVIRLATGETMVRLPTPERSPGGLA
jgi:hypothetical protein